MLEQNSRFGDPKTDEEIHHEVCRTLFRDGLLSPSDVVVYVHKGVVNLEGLVSDRKTKQYASECLSGIYGVQEVQNRLRLKADRGLVGNMNWPI